MLFDALIAINKRDVAAAFAEQLIGEGERSINIYIAVLTLQRAYPNHADSGDIVLKTINHVFIHRISTCKYTCACTHIHNKQTECFVARKYQ